MLGYEMASLLWCQLFTDDIQVNIFAQGTNDLDAKVIGGAIPEFHEQHYALFLQYYEADITSEEDQAAFDMLQEGNTVDFLLNGDLVDGNTKLKLTTALAKALGMEEAISLERNILEDNFLDGTIKMNQNFDWDFNYLRDAEGEENTLDFLSVTLHETGHILGFTSSLDFSLQQETLYSGREELSNFSPLDLFRFSAQSFTQNNPDGAVADLSIGGTAWFSVDGGETISAKMSTGKDGDGFQASHWERRYDPLGIMDPTLWYQERVEITDLDVLAFDVIGYDLSEEAENVEDHFSSEALAQTLAIAKINLAQKLGISIAELEAEIDESVPATPLTVFEEMGVDYYAVNTIEIKPNNPFSELSSSEELDNLPEGEIPDFFKDLDEMMGDIYKWWTANNNHKNAGWQELYEWWTANNNHKNAGWQELYEWWTANNNHKNAGWQELYEWWAANNNHKNAGWQELYEWWAANNNHKNAGWQELYEWWAANNNHKNAGWQELSEEELYQFHQEVSGEKGVWWEEVFFNTHDGSDVQKIDLPGENHNLVIGPAEPAITGGNQDEIIGGDAGDDEIIAGVGDDLIDGAEGSDTIFGDQGNDTVFGDQGNDSIQGGEGDDVLSGESGDDALLGEAGDDVLMGGENNDYLDGADGRDFLNGQTGNDALIGGAGDDALEGESGKDLLVGGSGEDLGNGGSGDDYIFGDDYSESLQQAFGNDFSNLTILFNSTTTETSGGENTNSKDLVLAQDPLRVEAESLSWTGQRYISNRSYASGGQLIRPKYTNQAIYGTTNFTGATGTYDIIIGYHDLEEANGQITVKVNGTSIDSWNLTKNLSDEELEAGNFTTHTISNISLTVNDALNLQSIMNYSDEGGEGAVDYIEFVPVVDNTPANELVLGQDPMKFEAEGLNWSGNYRLTNRSYASGGSLITNNSNNQWITGSGTFTGQTGTYQVVIGYHDMKIDNGEIQFQVNDNQIDSWDLSQNLYNDILVAGNFTTHTINNVSLSNNDSFSLKSLVDESYYGEGSIDYIEFILVELPATNDSNDSSSTDVNSPPETISITPEFEIGLHSDILRGGAGNDGIDGGAGNDIIFGEDEFNDSSNITSPLIDNAFQYGYSTYFLSQAGTWQEAQAEAQSYGGNLVTINDAAENIWLQNTFNTDESFWIGFSDSEQEGVWKWASGQSNTYTNWFHSEPNNSGNSQNYAVLNYYSNDGKWDDRHSSLDGLQRGVIEIDWSSVGGNDTIFGGIGNDQIYGNSGNDLIYGDERTVTETISETVSFQQGANGYNSTSDTNLYETSPNTNRSDRTFLHIDVDTNDDFQGLIRFDNIFGSESDKIAANDTIDSAFLEINLSNTGDNVNIHQMLRDWSNSSTWNSLENGISANNVEANSAPIATIDGSSKGIVKIDVTQSLKAWQTDPTSNYGWVLLLTNTADTQFDSSESTNPPRLIVNTTKEISNSTSTTSSVAVEGNDNITGNGGNDTISGGVGDDILNGTDKVVAGYYEKDVLIGGAGKDKFILGDEIQAFYATDSAQDYAVIEDFNADEDTVQLHGVAGDYQQQQQGNDVHLSRNGDLVAILENNSTLNLSSSAFEYISNA
ncbi:MAG: NF038122 family metalloprotease [Cyanobacteria bacterium P01_F01_bin.143]